jgi:hypothetical protein
MKTKSEIRGHILRGSAATLLFSGVVVAVSSAINLSSQPPKFVAPENNTAFGVNGHDSAWSLNASTSRRNLTLTFVDRVAYQRAIEEVYWRHRIWPNTNPGPKPPLDAVMSQATIEQKVKDYLRDSELLEQEWQKPITPEQLQAEMDWMAQHSKQPEVLRKLFAALGNDPFVIAECLARPMLLERMISSSHVTQTKVGLSTPKVVAAAAANYTLPKVSDGGNGCTDDTWTPTSITNAPEARQLPTAVWTGTEMIVWGGVGANSYLNSGGRYDPSTDRWTPTSTVNAPDSRAGHTAVWTGSEMIVWGGNPPVCCDHFNTGGRYNPSTDSWVATTTAGAPDGRSSHTAVWTGTEMVVWGGFNGTSGLRTGGRYNPNTDSWRDTSTMIAPSARLRHTAVWTGSEMIVWGGTDLFEQADTGGRYNPTADTWIGMSTSNVPDGRQDHTAVWTGTEMIVWGGVFVDFRRAHYLNTGGKYDPFTNSWAATSTVNAPGGRDSHTAIWNGGEMIVWGGSLYDGSSYHYFSTGGRYNPTADTWVATTRSNAPSARGLHTALWTGSEMIVWGGS